MEDSEGGPQMGLRIKPLWDPTGDVSVEFDEERVLGQIRAAKQR